MGPIAEQWEDGVTDAGRLVTRARAIPQRPISVGEGGHPILPFASGERGPSFPFQGKDFSTWSRSSRP
jgi:hypothetical protein